MGTYELANAVHKTTSLIENSNSDTVFGEKRKYINPILEALRLVMNKKAKIYLERELVPGNANSRVKVDIRDLEFDEEYVDSIYTFLKDNAVLTEPLREEELEELLIKK